MSGVNVVKGVGEVFFIPGASQLIDGNLKSGALHAVGAIVAGSLLGPVGWLAVGANSFSKSVQGKSLSQHFEIEKPGKKAKTE